MTIAVAICSLTVMTLMHGNRVVDMRIPESRSRTLTMSPARRFSHRGLIHGPRTSRSLHRSSRKTLALGNRSPARANIRAGRRRLLETYTPPTLATTPVMSGYCYAAVA